jgi:dTDP-4-dehydrorhamnose reductase
MKVLVTGGSGQVGRALIASAPASATVSALPHDALDIGNAEAVGKAVAAFRPAVIINAAAYTAVDQAEADPAAAQRINGDGPRYLAKAASSVEGCRLLQISTDYVFDGRDSAPYLTSSATGPVSVYGRSKLAGEQAVLSVLPERSAIVRTAWVYAARGRNFVLTMLRLMREKGAVRVVADQRGSPTSADSIARALWALAARPQLSGILHWTDEGVATWHEFACAISEEGVAAGLLPARASVTPITTAEYPTSAQRPANSMLDTRSTVSRLGIAPRPWREELKMTLRQIALA